MACEYQESHGKPEQRGPLEYPVQGSPFPGSAGALRGVQV